MKTTYQEMNKARAEIKYRNMRALFDDDVSNDKIAENIPIDNKIDRLSKIDKNKN